MPEGRPKIREDKHRTCTIFYERYYFDILQQQQKAHDNMSTRLSFLEFSHTQQCDE